MHRRRYDLPPIEPRGALRRWQKSAEISGRDRGTLRFRYALALLALLFLPQAASAFEDPRTLFRIPNASDAPQIRWDRDLERFSATGFEPDARVIWYGYSVELVANAWSRVRRFVGLERERGGEVTFTPQEPFGRISFWIAADFDSGEVGFARSHRRAIRRIPFAKLRLRGPTARRAALLGYAGRRLEVVWVRPGVGVWRRIFRDGGDDDDDRLRDGILVAPLDRLRPVGRTPDHLRIETVRQGDVVLLLDPDNLRALLLEAVGDLS